MKKILVIVSLILGGAACFFVRGIHRTVLYEAECKCAMAERIDAIVTNATGDVVQPLERMLRQGSFVDMKKFATWLLEDCLVGRNSNRKSIETFMAVQSNAVFGVSQVCNAFASVEYEVDGSYVASFRISARAQDGRLALKVVRHILTELELTLDKYNEVRRVKATSQFLESIQRLRLRGEDYSKEQRMYEEALKVCKRQEPRIEVLLSPRLSLKPR